MKTIDLVKQKILLDIADDERNVEIFGIVKNSLLKHWGKPVSRRIVKSVEEALKAAGEDFEVHFDDSLSWNGLHLTDNCQKDKLYRFTLNYHSEGKELSEENFDERNASYGSAAQERIEKNAKVLNNKKALEKLANAIDAINEANKVLEDKTFSSYNFPAHYDVLKLIEKN